jgi:hypothetical protein
MHGAEASWCEFRVGPVLVPARRSAHRSRSAKERKGCQQGQLCGVQRLLNLGLGYTSSARWNAAEAFHTQPRRVSVAAWERKAAIGHRGPVIGTLTRCLSKCPRGTP